MKKNKIIILTLTLLFSANLAVDAQTLVERAFLSMPDEYYLSLSHKKRREMLDAFRTDTAAMVQNRFGGQSRILQLDEANNFLSVQNSKSGTVQLKVLTTNDSTAYVALVFTACAPVCDAHIGFYDSSWQLLRTSLLQAVSINDFLDEEKIKADGKNLQTVVEQFDIIFLQYDFIGNDIQTKLNSKHFMEADNYKQLQPYLRSETVLFKWKNGKYAKE